jgi:hypothetical protein
MDRTIIAATLTLAAIVCTPVTTGTQTSDAKSHVLVTPGNVTWSAGPPSLPPGAQAAVLEGDPAKPGPFTLRIKLPDGYKIAPHYHPADEHVTVLQGTFVMGLGEKFDATAGHQLAVGSFAMMPTGTRHFAWTKGETIIQLHGIGPWGLTYVNPADDPRKKPSE